MTLILRIMLVISVFCVPEVYAQPERERGGDGYASV